MVIGDKKRKKLSEEDGEGRALLPYRGSAQGSALMSWHLSGEAEGRSKPPCVRKPITDEGEGWRAGREPVRTGGETGSSAGWAAGTQISSREGEPPGQWSGLAPGHPPSRSQI